MECLLVRYSYSASHNLCVETSHWYLPIDLKVLSIIYTDMDLYLMYLVKWQCFWEPSWFDMILKTPRFLSYLSPPPHKINLFLSTSEDNWRSRLPCGCRYCEGAIRCFRRRLRERWVKPSHWSAARVREGACFRKTASPWSTRTLGSRIRARSCSPGRWPNPARSGTTSSSLGGVRCPWFGGWCCRVGSRHAPTWLPEFRTASVTRKASSKYSAEHHRSEGDGPHPSILLCKSTSTASVV